MAQKLILCEGMVNEDVLSNPKVAAAIAGGMVVSSANGFATPNNKYMCLVLLSEAAAEPAAETTPTAETTPAAETSGSETEPAGEGGEGGAGDGGSE